MTDAAEKLEELAVEEGVEIAKFTDFDDDFQSKIAAMVLRDSVFNERTQGLLKPDYFENVAEAVLVNIGLDYFNSYKCTPDMATLAKLVKEAIAKKTIRKDMVDEVKSAIRRLNSADISGRDYVVEEVGSFAQYQALTDAILKSVEFIEKRKFSMVHEAVKKAMEVGASGAAAEIDYWGDIDRRTDHRKALVAGEVKRRGITTGVRILDSLLYHKGWGRKELALIMGGPKAGKSISLANFAKFASLAGYNVLAVTLEVSKEIYADRLDATVSDTAMKELESKIIEVRDRVKAHASKAGQLRIAEYPTGSLTPAMLRRLIASYKARGIVFDLIVVDYADLMKPTLPTTDPIENSKQIYTELRAISQEEDAAMLTATQTNREGAKSVTAKMDHVAEDFNRIRIADLVMSINATDEEKAKGEARLYMVASRNQQGDFAIRILQDKECMHFIKKVLGVE